MQNFISFKISNEKFNIFFHFIYPCLLFLSLEHSNLTKIVFLIKQKKDIEMIFLFVDSFF